LQNDATISFLRAARSGDIKKVIDYLESGEISDINSCNAVSLKCTKIIISFC